MERADAVTYSSIMRYLKRLPPICEYPSHVNKRQEDQAEAPLEEACAEEGVANQAVFCSKAECEEIR